MSGSPAQKPPQKSKPQPHSSSNELERSVAEGDVENQVEDEVEDGISEELDDDNSISEDDVLAVVNSEDDISYCAAMRSKCLWM